MIPRKGRREDSRKTIIQKKIHIKFFTKFYSSVSEHSKVAMEVGEGVTLPIGQGREVEGDDNDDDDDFDIPISLFLFTSSFCSDDDNIFWFWYLWWEKPVFSCDETYDRFASEVEIEVEVDSFDRQSAEIEVEVKVEGVWEKEEVEEAKDGTDVVTTGGTTDFRSRMVSISLTVTVGVAVTVGNTDVKLLSSISTDSTLRIFPRELDLKIPENPVLIWESRFVTKEEEDFKIEVEDTDKQGDEMEGWKEEVVQGGVEKERREFECEIVGGDLTEGNMESITERTDANPSFSGTLKVMFVNSFDQIGTTPKFFRTQ